MKKLLCVFAVMIFTVSAFGAAVDDAKTIGDVMPNAREIVRVKWDYSKDGGAIGDLDLLIAEDDVLVRMIGSKTRTSASSPAGTGTVTVGKESGSDFENGGAVTVYAADAYVAGDSAPFIKLASGESIDLGIATDAFVAGVIEFIFEVVRF